MSDVQKMFSPELRAMMGIYALYWKMDDAVGQTDLAPKLGHLECRLLIQLHRPLRMGALAYLLLTGPPSVTAAADRLERMGLVQRMADPDDRRALLLHLTQEGQLVRRKLQDLVSGIFRQVSGLSQDETEKLAALCTKIHDNVIGTGDPFNGPGSKGDTE